VSQPAPQSHRLRTLLLRLLAGTFLAWVLLEGTSSILYFLAKAWAGRAASERHARFDPELGWVSSPNVNSLNHFGPRISLRTNAQGFRNDHTFSRQADGRTRIICSGDSFTFGYGVDNDHTWCQLLQALDPSLETINMGQGGYGLDQAYLWYVRDGEKLHHSIQLFAFIGLDFGRMASSTYLGAPKPTLSTRNGLPIVVNYPLQRPLALTIGLARGARQATALASGRLIIALARRFDRQRAQQRASVSVDDVATSVFHDLALRHRQRGSRLVLVFLPRQQDFDAGDSEHWRRLVRRVAEIEGVPFWDLVEDFRDLDSGQIGRLFIQPGSDVSPDAVGHYSQDGNAWVAREIHNRLKPLVAGPA
jgi:hypothetical protein